MTRPTSPYNRVGVDEAPEGGELTVTLTVWVWEAVPLVAVTVTGYVPDVDERQESVAVVEDGRVMVVGLIVHDRPEGAEMESVTIPEKPFCPVRMIVDVAGMSVLTGDGEDAAREKSGAELDVIVKAKKVLWTSVPLVALTATE
jgi:hypothetical protein